MEVPSSFSDNDFEIIQKDNTTFNEGCTVQFECQVCERRFKRKSTLNRHVTMIHERSNLDKLKLENEAMELKIKLYIDQIRFLKRLILIQDHTVRSTPTSGFYSTNPIPQLPFSINNK